MRSTISKALFLFLSVFFSLQVFAASLYCDYTNGNDANDCTNGTTELCQTLQRCVNVATRGDTIHIANTSAQVLTASLSFAAGFTNTGNDYIRFVAWDNGGSITIQRPDEVTARVAATITGDGTFPYLTNSSLVSKSFFQNIKFSYSYADSVLLWANSADDVVVEGCEFDSGTSTGTNQLLIYTGSFGTYINNYIKRPSTGGIYGVFGAASNKFINNYFKQTGTFSSQTIPFLSIAGAASMAVGNIFVSTQDTTLIGIVDQSLHTIENNTFVASSSKTSVGISFATNVKNSIVANNVFYKFNGTSSKPIKTSGTGNYESVVGKNAYYDCNANDSFDGISLNLTGDDISASGDPFVDSASDDYTLDTTTGAASIGAGLANPNSSIDIGAVQSAAGGGGGSSEHSYSWVN